MFVEIQYSPERTERTNEECSRILNEEGHGYSCLAAYENYTSAAHLRAAVPRPCGCRYTHYKTGIIPPVSADEVVQENCLFLRAYGIHCCRRSFML